MKSLPAGHPLLAPAESNEYHLMWRFPAYRIAIISDIFREVYGDASMMTRVRPVLMTQQGDLQATLQIALNWLDGFAHRRSPPREVRSYVFAAGGSGYYGANRWPMSTPGDRTEFFADGNYPARKNVLAMGLDAVWAGNFGLRRIAYEGGPSLDGFTDAQANALNLDPRMQDLVVRTHDAWSGIGGDLLMYYVLVGPREWAFTPSITDLSSPKLLALAQLRNQPRVPVTLGASLPGVVSAVLDASRADNRIRTGYDYSTLVGGQTCIGGNDVGKWVALAGHSASAFTGVLTVSGSATSAVRLAVWVNGERRGEVTLRRGGGLATSTGLPTPIPSGLVVIRLEPLDGAFALCSIRVK